MGRCVAVLLEGVGAFGVPVLPCLQLECGGRDRCQKNFEIAKAGLEHKINTSVGRLITEKKSIFSKLVVLTSYRKSSYWRLLTSSCTFFSFCPSCMQ